MKISELPKDLQILARKREREQFPDRGDFTDSLMDAFDWATTEEGGEFWANLCKHKIDKTIEK